MFDKLKELSKNHLLTIDNKSVSTLMQEDADSKIINSTLYAHELGELLIIECENYYLICHTFSDSPKYFVYQLESTEDADNPQYIKNDCFKSKIILQNRKPIVYKQSTIGAIYDLASDTSDSTISCCEYRCKTKYWTHMFLEKNNDDLNVFKGFEIKKRDIVL